MTPSLKTGLVLAAVVGALALPFALGTGLHVSGWHPESGGPNGRLIEPPRPLPPEGLVGADGAPLATAALHGHWWLLLVGQGPCGDDCVARVDEMRRIHVALNRDMPRLKRMLLTESADGDTAAMRAAQPDLVVAHADAAWKKTLDTSEPRYFVIDPQARVMMRYPSDVQPAAVYADLMRLLRYSAAG